MSIGSPTFTGITITPPAATAYAGAYVNLTATAHYDDGTTSPLGPIFHSGISWPATWTADDATIATVSSTSATWGRVYGIAPGTTTVTVQVNGHSDDPAYGATAEVTIASAPAVTVPAARFSLGFGADTLDPYPTWTAIDAHPNLVTSYTIDRGRSYELDQTGAGTATVQILDPDGILDPTNPAGAHYGQIRPMLQAKLCRRNPVTGAWQDRYRGFVTDYVYDVDASQQVNRLTVSLVDLFDICGSAQMQLGQFGTNQKGEIVYAGDRLPRDRINEILDDLGLPDHLRAIFSGNVHLQAGTYSPGQSPLTAIQDAADAEFPAVANLFCDRHGRLSFHGRHARFDPVSAAAANREWDYHDWKAGDAAAVAASPTDTAQVRALSFQRSVSKIINTAIATEQGAPDDVTSRQVADTGSIATYGLRSWSQSNLLTASGDLAETYPANAATETKRFATFYVANYAQPQNRISSLGFRSLDPGDPRAAANWNLLSLIDISDTIEVTVATAGGGGFHSAGYFVEGIHENVQPLQPGYDDVTVTLDLSPRAYYTTNPWVPLIAADAPPDAGNRNPRAKHTSPGAPAGIGSSQVPAYHGPDHGYYGPDPIPIAYENVGAPIGGGGGGGGIQFDTVNVGGWLYIRAEDKTEGDGAGEGIHLQTFDNIFLEANTSSSFLLNDGTLTIESDRVADLGPGVVDLGLVLRAPTSAVSLSGRRVVIQNESGTAAGSLTIDHDGNTQLTGDGSLAIVGGGTGGITTSGTLTHTGGDVTFDAATFNGSVIFASFVECHSALDVNGIATFGGDTEFDAKVGFYGNNPIAQPAHPTVLADVIAALVNLGLVAP